MTSVGTPLDLPPREWPAVTSPDGAHDALTVFSGSVADDANRYRILVADRSGGQIGCGSAWKKDPVSGVIGVEKGPLIPVV